MRVLAIESSCDETAAAVVVDDGTVLSDVVRTQIAAHAPYGGVVPEIAARDHLKAVVPVVEAALAQANMTLFEVDGLAVTCRPGLVGSLLVGVQAAKGLAWASDKPLVGVDHLVGHLLAVFLRTGAEPGAPAPPEGSAPPRRDAEPCAQTRSQPSTPPTHPARPPQFPFIGLVVSGGHTALYDCAGHRPEQIEELGATRDDAVGEAYDKVAKLLGLGYPGGPVVDRLASRGRALDAPVKLSPPMAHGGSLEFSFSGLKSAIARHVASNSAPQTEQDLCNLCAAFQAAVCRTLVSKTMRAAVTRGASRVVLAGGVAANRGLRAAMAASCARRGIELHLPAVRHCTDNAAMIAYAGALRLGAGERDGYELGPSTTTSLLRHTRKGRGKR